jgi:hypothetical protein
MYQNCCLLTAIIQYLLRANLNDDRYARLNLRLQKACQILYSTITVYYVAVEGWGGD